MAAHAVISVVHLPSCGHSTGLGPESIRHYILVLDKDLSPTLKIWFWVQNDLTKQRCLKKKLFMETTFTVTWRAEEIHLPHSLCRCRNVEPKRWGEKKKKNRHMRNRNRLVTDYVTLWSLEFLTRRIGCTEQTRGSWEPQSAQLL